MLFTSKLKIVLIAAAGFATPLAMTTAMPGGNRDIAAIKDQPALIELATGSVRYRVAGDFTRAGKPAESSLVTVRTAQPLAIMKKQVSGADYQRCVSEDVCRALPSDVAVTADRPVVMVSWRDAIAYAAWLSRKTGETYRLPTDEEWAYAAGSRYQDDSLPIDNNDPSKRWLARYERESSLKSVEIDSEPRPFGAFGANENGLLDVAGNVWEWTNTCFVRTALDDAGKPLTTTANCGVRVVEGQHRAYVTDFIRDARAGGCAAGVPPSNLGFRLVRESKSFMRWLLLSGLSVR